MLQIRMIFLPNSTEGFKQKKVGLTNHVGAYHDKRWFKPSHKPL